MLLSRVADNLFWGARYLERAQDTARIVRSFTETGRVPNVVNLARTSPATHMLVVRHRDRPGVLAHIFEQLHDAGINVQETENIVFEGAVAAVARINVDHAPSAELVAAIAGGNEDVLSTQLVAL
jgi:D-3-phosphoglycerate dehydrogenase